MVTCHNCGANNAAEHAFCSTCGTQLARSCPNCSTPNDPSNSFCFSCGTNLGDGAGGEAQPAAAPAPTESSGERRLVSVVFADLVGFTSFSEDRDPEDVRNMLTRYYERCREIIGRFGGTTDKFIGDAVMGVWGAVEAHEDDAERATRAAIELVDMVEGLGSDIGVPDLSARAGVLSGEASVGSGGNEHGLVVGDLVNTASRLQSIAPPGQVYAGETTRDLVGGAVEFQPAGDHEVKGKAQLVPAFRAVRVVAISTATRSGELGEAPFVGRDDELRMLKDQMHAVGREGRARMVSVIGEAGIGKTRLSQELVRYIDGITEDIYYHSGRSPSYGDGVTFWALGEMIRERAGILEGEDEAKSRMKLRTTVAEYAPDEEEQRWIEPRLAAVIGLAEMPSGDRSELYAALRTFFQRIAQHGTVAMVFEDLHWADEGLLDFIEELVERTTQHPILVVALARPDLVDRRSDWGAVRRRSLLMHLSRLDDASMRKLVSGLAPGLPDDVVERIADRTAGVPLHAVEFVRMLYNSGQLERHGDEYVLVGDPGELSVPDTVSAIIGARLDRLDSAEASLIQDASVLGYSFTLAAIADMRGVEPDTVEPALLQLVRVDILELDEDPRSPERGQFRFVQGLIKEVAYGRLSKAERVARHLEVARRLEALDDIELAGVIADHYASAAKADLDNAELQDRARATIFDAGQRAEDLHSYAQAATLYGKAEEMTDDPDERAHIGLRLARATGLSGRTDLAADRAVESLEHFTAVGDVEARGEAAAVAAQMASGEWGGPRAAEMIRRVYDETPRSETEAWARLASSTSRFLMLASEYEEAITVADEAIPILQELALTEMLVETIINKGTSVAWVGSFTEGSALLLGAAEIAAEHGLTKAEVRALNNHASVVARDIEAPLHTADRMDELIDRSGDAGWVFRRAYFRGVQSMSGGRLDEAEAYLHEADDLDISDLWASIFESTWIGLDFMRGDRDEEKVRRFLEISDEHLDIDDAQWRENALFTRFVTLHTLGLHEQVIEETLELNAEDEYAYALFARPALYSLGFTMDSAGAAAIRAELPTAPAYLRAEAGSGHLADMVVAGIAGDTGRAFDAYTQCVSAWEHAAVGIDLALARATYAHMVGLDAPGALDAATQARDFFVNASIVCPADQFEGLFAQLDDTGEALAVESVS